MRNLRNLTACLALLALAGCASLEPRPELPVAAARRRTEKGTLPFSEKGKGDVTLFRTIGPAAAELSRSRLQLRRRLGTRRPRHRCGRPRHAPGKLPVAAR